MHGTRKRTSDRKWKHTQYQFEWIYRELYFEWWKPNHCLSHFCRIRNCKLWWFDLLLQHQCKCDHFESIHLYFYLQLCFRCLQCCIFLFHLFSFALFLSFHFSSLIQSKKKKLKFHAKILIAFKWKDIWFINFFLTKENKKILYFILVFVIKKNKMKTIFSIFFISFFFGFALSLAVFEIPFSGFPEYNFFSKFPLIFDNHFFLDVQIW